MATETSAPGAAASPVDPERPRTRGHLPRAAPGLLAALACLGLAVLSAHTLPSVPDYDEFSWLVWGHELAHRIIAPHGPFMLLGGPSWKPFPVLFTTIFGFFGASVTLWVVFVRAVGLFALWLAYRIGERLGASERWEWSGRVAGVLAAVSICLLLQWFHFMFRATSEPLTVTATLWWVQRALAGRRLQGLLAGIMLATMRPEAGIFVALYGLWLLWLLRHEGGVWRRVSVIAGVLLVPAAWIVPPWIAVGQPLQASSRARAYEGNEGHAVATFVLQRAEQLVVWPVLVLAGALLLAAIWRRERAILALVAASAAYAGVIELMALHGFPGLPRFMLPSAAIISVLAAVTVARLGTRLGGGPAAAAMITAILAVCVPFCVNRASQLTREYDRATVAAHYDAALASAARAAGGSHGVLPCRSSHVGVNHVVQPSLAYKLGVGLARVWPLDRHPNSLRGPSVAFVAHGNAIAGRAPARLRRGYVARELTRVRMWRVLRVTWADQTVKNRCVGARAAGSRPPVRSGAFAASPDAIAHLHHRSTAGPGHGVHHPRSGAGPGRGARHPRSGRLTHRAHPRAVQPPAGRTDRRRITHRHHRHASSRTGTSPP